MGDDELSQCFLVKIPLSLVWFGAWVVCNFQNNRKISFKIFV